MWNKKAQEVRGSNLSGWQEHAGREVVANASGPETISADGRLNPSSRVLFYQHAITSSNSPLLGGLPPIPWGKPGFDNRKCFANDMLFAHF